MAHPSWRISMVAPMGRFQMRHLFKGMLCPFDRQKNEWVDGETLFLRASVWRGAGEHVAQSLAKGMRVIATGVLKSRSYETRAGEKRTVIELDVEEIGPSLRYATVPRGFINSEVSSRANPRPQDAVNGGPHPAVSGAPIRVGPRLANSP
jgi:single-strand DNA-binding protein